MDEQAVIAGTRRWISDMVIGLDLCPFAARVFQAGLIRYIVTGAASVAELFEVLTVELRALAAAALSEVETTLLIHPHALTDFLDYNDFLGDADRLVAQLGLTGIVQIASFHPQYRFAGTAAEAVENYTNRSPFPMLHLLREESLSAIGGDAEELAEIPRRNIELLRRLGREKVLERLRAVTGRDS